MTEAYDTYISVTEMAQNWSKMNDHYLIKMVDCKTIENPKFKEGGIYYDFLVPFPGLTYLCPENGDLPIYGSFGTSLWVVPKQNSTNFPLE